MRMAGEWAANSQASPSPDRARDQLLSMPIIAGILQLQVDKGIALVDIVRELHP